MEDNAAQPVWRGLLALMALLAQRRVSPPDHMRPGSARPDFRASASPGLPREMTKAASMIAASRKLLYLLRKSGAGDGIRTHDPNLGKVVLYP